MSILLQTYLHIDLRLTDIEKEKGKENFEKIIKEYSKLLYKQDVEVKIHYEDGSVKYWFTVLGALYLAIANYGSFRAGVDQIIEDSKVLNNIICTELYKSGIDESTIIENKRIQTTPDKVRRINLKLDRIENKKIAYNNKQYRNEIQNTVDYIDKLLLEIDEEDKKLILNEIQYRNISELNEIYGNNFNLKITNDYDNKQLDYFNKEM